jgi:hypothetical protein
MSNEGSDMQALESGRDPCAVPDARTNPYARWQRDPEDRRCAV